MKDNAPGSRQSFAVCNSIIDKFLPSALRRALVKYKEFAKHNPDVLDSKDFHAHQAGCKAALQHIELLIKLAATLDIPKTSLPQNDLAALMEKAGDELSAYQSKSRGPAKTKGA